MTFLTNVALQDLYHRFMQLDEEAYYDKVRFYEQHHNAIKRLDDNLKLDLHLAYLNALFITRKYKKFIPESQLFLQEYIMNSEVSEKMDRDIYHEVINCRAISLYHCQRCEEAEHVVKELLKMDYTRRDAHYLLYLILKQKQEPLIRFLKASLVMTLIMTAVLMVTQQVIVMTYFPDRAQDFLNMVTWCAIPIFLILGIVQVYVYIKARFGVVAYVHLCRRKKQSVSE